LLSVSQNTLNTKLIAGLTNVVKNLNPHEILNAGATDLRYFVPVGDLPAVLVMYNKALRWVFIVGIIMACLSAIGSFALEWKSVKDRDRPPRGEDDE